MVQHARPFIFRMAVSREAFASLVRRIARQRATSR
jgi:hypothetical protein